MREPDLNPPGIVVFARSPEEELAQKIREREEKGVESALKHARLQGVDLLQAKRHLGPRKFAPWLRENFRFSRKTAYDYMKVASKWDFICKDALQIASIQEVLEKVFGKGKAKKKSEPGSMPETGPTNNRPDEEPGTENVAGERSEGPSNSDRSEVQGPDQDQRTAEQESAQQPNQQSRERDDAEDEDESGKTAPKESGPILSQAESEGVASNPHNALVIPIKDPRVYEHFQGLLTELLDYHRKGSFPLGGIFPEQIRAIASEEDTPVKLILALIQLRIETWKSLEKMKESREEKKTQKRERQRGK